MSTNDSCLNGSGITVFLHDYVTLTFNVDKAKLSAHR